MMIAKPCMELSELGDEYLEFDVIGVDEGQLYLHFFKNDITTNHCQ